VQRTQVHAGTQQRVGSIGLGQGAIAGDGGETFEPGTDCIDAGEIDLRQSATGQCAGRQPGGKLTDGCEGDVLVIIRKSLRHRPGES
jgi:hypothetical protein